MKIIWVKALALLIILTVMFGCGREPQAKPAEQAKEKIRVAVSVANGQTEDDKIFQKQLTDKAAKESVEIQWLDAQGDPLKQNDDIEKAVQNKAKVLVVEAVDSEMIKSALQDAQKKGLKVIALELLPPDTWVDGLIAHDYQRAGEMQARQVLQTVKSEKPLNILILRGSKDNPVEEKVVAGNLDILNKDPQNNRVRIKEITDSNASAAFNTVKDYLAGESIPQVILTHSPETTQGVLEAVNMSGKQSQVATFGMGTAAKAVEALKAGRHKAEIDFMPSLTAQTVLQAAVKISKDEPWEYEEQVQNGTHNIMVKMIPLRSVTAENIDILKDKLEIMQKLKLGQEKEQTAGQKTQQQGQQSAESGQQGENRSQSGTSGNKTSGGKSKSVVKIKTKDGGIFEMNIEGEVTGIEVKDAAQESDKNRPEGQEDSGGEDPAEGDSSQ